MADPVNAQFLVDRLMAGGLNRAQAAALVGNFQQESSLNPIAHNRKENAFGLMQWRGDRLVGLQKYASEHGKAWTDPGVQADYALHEMNTTEKDASKNFLAATDVNEANKALYPVIRYRNPAEMGLRAAYGQQINDDQYGNREGPQAAATTQAPNVSRETSQQPNRSQYVDPLGVYDQFKSNEQPVRPKGIRGGLTALGQGIGEGAKPVIRKAGGLGSIFGMGGGQQPGNVQPGTPAGLTGFTGLFGKPSPGSVALGQPAAQPTGRTPAQPAPYPEAGAPQQLPQQMAGNPLQQDDPFALQTAGFGALV